MNQRDYAPYQFNYTAPARRQVAAAFVAEFVYEFKVFGSTRGKPHSGTVRARAMAYDPDLRRFEERDSRINRASNREEIRHQIVRCIPRRQILFPMTLTADRRAKDKWQRPDRNKL
jgi:hypothetical protein